MTRANQKSKTEKNNKEDHATEENQGEGGFVETMRDVAMVAKSSFPELIDYYDPEKDEIV